MKITLQIFFFQLIIISAFGQSLYEKNNEVIDLPKRSTITNIKTQYSYKVKKGDTSLVLIRNYSKLGFIVLERRINLYETGIDTSDYIAKYDGNKILTENGPNNRYRFKYDYKNGVISKIVKWDWNNDSVVKSFTYLNGNVSEVQVLSNGNTNTIKFEYDKNQNLISKSSGDETYYKYVYDSLGNLIQEINTDSEYGFIERVNEYNKNSLIIKSTGFYGHNLILDIRKYQYNSRNELTEWVHINGKRSIWKIVKYHPVSDGELREIFYKRQKKKPDEIFFDKYIYWE